MRSPDVVLIVIPVCVVIYHALKYVSLFGW
ncbi:Uncharacterised protein [Serratia quinivorans]|nr:Uncharacterised protein [Serratia quinivorans]